MMMARQLATVHPRDEESATVAEKQYNGDYRRCGHSFDDRDSLF